MKDDIINHSEYQEWILEIKLKIHSTRHQVALAVNVHLLELYWQLGKEISQKQVHAQWGSKFIEQLAVDLKHEFPDIKGFSRRNLYAIRQWYLFYAQEFPIVPQPVAQIPWGHNRLIINKTDNIKEALFYATETANHAWSRDTLDAQIASRLYDRKGKAITNFQQTLPEQKSKMANALLKDPYNFDFLGLEEDALEREIEHQMMAKITDFLLELGKGFAFVGRQYKLEISETDYFLDLLFYHLDLRCYVVIELKAGKFKPEHTGKLNFYLSAVDSQVKKAEDNPTIGILLCKSKDKIEAEYALRDIQKPMGISEYRLSEAIPENIKGRLPSIEELEGELAKKMNKEK